MRGTLDSIMNFFIIIGIGVIYTNKQTHRDEQGVMMVRYRIVEKESTSGVVRFYPEYNESWWIFGAWCRLVWFHGNMVRTPRGLVCKSKQSYRFGTLKEALRSISRDKRNRERNAIVKDSINKSTKIHKVD